MAKICKLNNVEKVWNVEDVKNRQDKSKLCISCNYCYDIFESGVINFDEITDLRLTGTTSLPDSDFITNFLNFKNLKYLSLNNLWIDEPKIWQQFAINCTNLKEIFFKGHWCDLSKEHIIEIFKIPTLETISFVYVDLTYWPPGPSNIKNIDLTSICYQTETIYEEEIFPEYENFYTHQNLEEINIRTFAFPISVLNLDKCLNLTTITIQTNNEVNLYEFVQKILKLPKLNKITFKYCYFEKFVTDNSLIFPNVTEIYINDCYKNSENGQRYNYRSRFHQKHYTEEPFKQNLRVMINQCPKLKILMFDNESLI